MEKQEQISFTIRVFSFLMKEAVNKDFVFPGGGISRKTMAAYIDSLKESGTERLTNYCICQVFAICSFGSAYNGKWNVSHSFGKKAIERFDRNTKANNFREDEWLKRIGLSRTGLLWQFRQSKEHPLEKFIYPEYEERTKQRMHNSEVGFYICQISTLLWTPFSKACRSCKNEQRCKNITGRKYEELYRIRTEEYKKSNRK
ncbi:hypothetical protein [Dysgonomonas sp. ZJ709]|uniref:hypothetical protein n=1 Tax=Dysgonomonas sp. ZJ709 TaxID=2709797 RepID=UPI0013EC45EE|nr:hypothetical protein [Dysgonomonas sp. ZJ709]